MSKFNEFTQAFDEAVEGGYVDRAAVVTEDYIRAHSAATGKSLQDSFNIVRAWMGYDGGENREAHTRHTPEGQQALAKAVTALGCQM